MSRTTREDEVSNRNADQDAETQAKRLTAVEVLDAALDLVLAGDELDKDVVLDVEGLAFGVDALGAEVGGERLLAVALLAHLERLRAS